MFKSLYAKLALALTLWLVGVAALYTPLSLNSTRLYLQETDQRFNRDLAARLAESRPLFEAGRINKPMLKEIFDLYMVINPNIEVYLLDSSGKILDFAIDPAKVVLERVSLEPISHFLEANARLPILGDDPCDPKRGAVFSAAMVHTGEDMQGYLYVVLRSHGYESVAGMVRDSHILRLALVTIAVTLLFGLLAGLLIFRLLTRRLSRLSGAMAAFQAGAPPAETTTGLPADGDEVDRLGATFDTLALRIDQQMEALRNQDNLRRELVANASHDLRTPLASLHGYLETLQIKDQDLSPEERRRYLETALRHSERLSRLVEDLFELAKLEACETRANPEPVAIAELAHDVAQKFQHDAQRRGIALTMAPLENPPLIHADIRLMERALENLIGNALRHTPEGGRVTLALALRDGFLELSVEDTGSGIPATDLPHLFDRYFRAGKSTGSGLGLAITRRIMELHCGAVTVESAPGQGSSFTLRLPLEGTATA